MNHSLCDNRLLRLISHLHRIHVSMFLLSCTCTQKLFITCEPTPSSSPAQQDWNPCRNYFFTLLSSWIRGSGEIPWQIQFLFRKEAPARLGRAFHSGHGILLRKLNWLEATSESRGNQDLAQAKYLLTGLSQGVTQHCFPQDSYLLPVYC